MKHFGEAIPLDNEARISRLERQLAREKAARQEAEKIAETGLRDLYNAQRRLLLLQRITQAANNLNDFHSSLKMTMHEVCTEMNWEFGNAFRIDEQTGEAYACDLWSAISPDRFFPFIEASRNRRFAKGVGLPGRVLEDGKPHWIDDVRGDGNFPRRRIARKCGIISGCAFPIVVNQEIVAVVEFFSRKLLIESDYLVSTFSQIGSQLASVYERERSRKTLLHDAHHDLLTSLPNRTLLKINGDEAFVRVNDIGGCVCALVIDLDGFKTVNDRFGHRVGDLLLVEVTQRLTQVVETWRRGRVMENRAMHVTTARSGGDEFIALIDGEIDPPSIFGLSELIREEIQRPAIIENKMVAISASVGIASKCEDIEDIETLIRDADLAMYKAKSTGRGKMVSFTQELGHELRKRRQTAEELRRAVQNHEFLLEYQPILGLDSKGRVEGFEALVRWDHPGKGLTYPSEFIEIAEETGLIVYIGDWVLREACAAAQRLNRGIDSSRRRFMSINVAAQQLLQENFLDQLLETIETTGVDPHTIRLEITESVAISAPEKAKALLEKIRETGVKTSLDDFGTGHSSLSYLRGLPLDSIKIDKSFINHIQEQKSHDIVKAIIELANALELSVVAEGIESEIQDRLLREMGCSYGQGYFYGRPVAEPEAFRGLMQAE